MIYWGIGYHTYSSLRIRQSWACSAQLLFKRSQFGTRLRAGAPIMFLRGLATCRSVLRRLPFCLRTRKKLGMQQLQLRFKVPLAQSLGIYSRHKLQIELCQTINLQLSSNRRIPAASRKNFGLALHPRIGLQGTLFIIIPASLWLLPPLFIIFHPRHTTKSRS